jgi:hypothetical protein
VLRIAPSFAPLALLFFQPRVYIILTRLPLEFEFGLGASEGWVVLGGDAVRLAQPGSTDTVVLDYPDPYSFPTLAKQRYTTQSRAFEESLPAGRTSEL